MHCMHHRTTRYIAIQGFLVHGNRKRFFDPPAGMDSGRYIVTFLLALSFATTALSESIIRLPSANHSKPTALSRRSGIHDNLYCESWKFAVDTNDAPFFSRIPKKCQQFVKEYMTGMRYLSDSEAVADYAFSFAETVEIAGDGKDAWVFDIDETLLSNLPYYAKHGYGIEPFDEKSFYEWVDLALAPALPASLRLYMKLQDLGFTLFLLTARAEYARKATEKNLLRAGYSDYKRLILKGPADLKKSDMEYKSERRKELEEEGYKLHGSNGDLWSDLLGFSVAERSFKLPNILYN